MSEQSAELTRALQVEVLGPAPIYLCRLTDLEYLQGKWTHKEVEAVLRGLHTKLIFAWEHEAGRWSTRIVAYAVDVRNRTAFTVLDPPPTRSIATGEL